MTPEQIALVQSSYERLGPRRPAMATRFYQELFAQDAALRALFSTDLAEQEARFADKLTEIVLAMPRLGELLVHTQALGALHVGHGVRAADYQKVGAALVAALAAVLGEGFDGPTREAWTLAYNLIAETMLEGAAAGRAVARCPDEQPAPPVRSHDETDVGWSEPPEPDDDERLGRDRPPHWQSG
jgi:hemoglobin-like flavoprotein